MSVSHISPHFTWTEAACHDGTEVPIEFQPFARRLASKVLEPIRERFNGPLIPLSWYRTPEHNTRVGGAPHSFHMQALAADIRPVEIGALVRLERIIEEMIRHGELPCLGGFGVYKNWIHVDARPLPPGVPAARWLGRGIGAEKA